MEGVNGSSSMGATAIDAMKKGMKVQEKQMQDLLGSAEAQQNNVQQEQKNSQLAAQSTGLGVNINLKG
jgi:hypothetical protein